MFAVVDYAKGNLMSVARGLEAAGARDVQVVSDPERIAQADAIVLPGVGAFADAARSMADTGQMHALRQAIHAGVPFLGICLGLHLLFAAGTEDAPEDAPIAGLGIIDGVVGRMPNRDAQGSFFKVPHVGWNTVDILDACESPLLTGVSQGEHFYFTHSYVAPENPCTQATTTHSIEFPCFVDWKNTCFGVQFHPEKSSDAGLRVLGNFVALAKQSGS